MNNHQLYYYPDSMQFNEHTQNFIEQNMQKGRFGGHQVLRCSQLRRQVHEGETYIICQYRNNLTECT